MTKFEVGDIVRSKRPSSNMLDKGIIIPKNANTGYKTRLLKVFFIEDSGAGYWLFYPEELEKIE